MSVIIVDAKPGFGKTLSMSWFALDNFKRKNPPLKIWFTEKILRKPYIYDLSEYSDFPILLKDKRKNGKPYYYKDINGDILSSDKLYTLSFRIFDLFCGHYFLPGANFYIDEIQQKYDSMEYKDFPDSIAHYFQCHRHFDNNIYTNSQSQSRIIKRVLCLGEEFWSIYSFRILLGFCIMHIRITYEMHNNLESNNGNLNVDSTDKRLIFRIKKIGGRYSSKYLSAILDDTPPYQTKMYDSLYLTKEQILHNFFPTEEERKALLNRDF